ncbi:MAG: hypothetical protein HYZ84_07380 [Candidatus Omnitrophica bacterium]|nr:hypothetical protein [Candidatus Omnitrophota bacterium]
MEKTFEDVAGIVTGSSRKPITIAQADEVIVYVHYNGYQQLRAALRLVAMLKKQSRQFASHTAGEVRNVNEQLAALENLLRFPKDAKTPEPSGRFALLLPKKLSRSFAESFMKSLRQANLNNSVTVVGSGEGANTITNIATRELGRNRTRRISKLNELKGEEAIPTGIFDQNVPQLPENLIPFRINMEEITDPLVRQYVEQFQIVALIHTARILAAHQSQPNAKPMPAADLLEKLLESLNRSGVDYSSIISLAQNQFIISATAAKIFLKIRSELRVKIAA